MNPNNYISPGNAPILNGSNLNANVNLGGGLNPNINLGGGLNVNSNLPGVNNQNLKVNQVAPMVKPAQQNLARNEP